jgi:uncharacterized protein (DUF433 family)
LDYRPWTIDLGHWTVDFELSSDLNGLKKEGTMERIRLDRIEINPKIMVGKPVIKGTRIPVELILKMLSQGIATEEILGEYLQLTKEDIQAALAYGVKALEVEEVYALERAGK